MALGDSYAALTDLKPSLGIPVTDTSDDAALTDALAAASREIEGHCGRQFNLATATSARVYMPDNYYLVTTDDFTTVNNPVVVQSDYGFDGVFETTWQSGDYSLEPLNGVVDGDVWSVYWKIRAVKIRWWPIWVPTATVYPRPSIQITAQWGWPSVPVPVKRACVMLAAQNYLMKDAPMGVQGVNNFGPVRVHDVPRVEAMLQRYCKTTALVA